MTLHASQVRSLFSMLNLATIVEGARVGGGLEPSEPPPGYVPEDNLSPRLGERLSSLQRSKVYQVEIWVLNLKA